MYRSLYFKIILLFAVFMITVMAVVGTVLLNSVFRFYTNEFATQMEQCFAVDPRLRSELAAALSDENSYSLQKDILTAYGTTLGIDVYRNFFILDMNGNAIQSSNEDQTENLEKTPNIVSAMKGQDGNTQIPGSEYSDYAIYISNGQKECIIYIRDTQQEMRELSWQLFSLILQSVFFGLLIAMVLSFFLAKAITSPIRSLTKGAQLVSAGEFSHEINVRARDEIGVLTATFNDMKTALKNTLDEVGGERQKLATVLANLKDAVIAYSDDGRVMQINQSAKNLFGEAYSVCGDNFTLGDMLHLLCIEYVMKSGAASESSLQLREIVYDNKALDITISEFGYAEQNHIKNGYITVIHDVTARYELDKAQREFVANVSHELRTPLTVIKGSAETLQMYPDMDKSMSDTFLGNVVEESDRMLRIVGDLLTLSRLDNHKTKWQVSSFSIRQSLAHLCDILSVDAQTHGHKIIFEEAAPLPTITGDKERLEQVIINIVSNSIKYTPDNGIIRVRASADDENVIISIKDNGIGIPEEDIPRLFERFYRVEKSRTSDTGGTGLGLAIAKEIVVAHGGKITVKSKVGAGTEVVITLPIETCLKENDA